MSGLATVARARRGFEVSLGTLCTAIRGVTFPASESSPEPFDDAIACLTTAAVKDDVEWGTARFIPRSRMRGATQLLQAGDVLVSTANSKELVGRACLVGEPPSPSTFGAFVTVLRPQSNVDPQFLILLLRTRHAREYCYVQSSNTTNISNLRVSDLLAMPVPSIPLTEQKRIASVLRQQLDAAARMRAAVDCHDACMAAFADATLQTAFADAAVAGACRVPLGDVCSIESPQVNPTQPQFGSLPHVSGENIESTTGRLLDLRSAADDGMISGKYLFEPGDVLYSKLRPYLRKVALVDFRGICSADMYPLRADRTRLDSRYLKWLLLSSEFTTYADEESRRARMPKLNREQLFAFEAPMPDLPDQQRIAAALQHRFDAALSIRAMTAELAEDIGRLPAALLRRAFSPAAPRDS